MKRALIVVDMQEFAVGTEHEKMFTYDNTRLTQNVNAYIKHYESNSVYYIINIMNDNIINKFAPFRVYENTPAAALTADLDVVSNKHFLKYKGDAFSTPELHTALQDDGITDIDIVGVDGSGCVYLTAMGALKHGYNVRIIKNAVGSISPKKADKCFKKLVSLGVEVV